MFAPGHALYAVGPFFWVVLPVLLLTGIVVLTERWSR